uniref:Glucose-6-phosphatase catalytic subunit 1 n=1 Tax=Lates calcarifer TaxID=8187 RepID=A0A4W6BIU7_LATCA
MDAVQGFGGEHHPYLQTNYQDAQGLFLWVSWAADLRNTFFIFFPLWFHLRASVDWLNLVFKCACLCCVPQDPVWGEALLVVHETAHYANTPLMSYPLCLCYAGSPSGHAMGAAGVYYTLVTSILAIMTSKKKHGSKKSTNKEWYLKAVLWTLFWGVQVCVCLSRVFIAAHFPHQVIAGVITGMIVAEAFNRTQWIYSASMKKYFYTTLFLTSFAVGFYILLKALGVDLLWTLEKAQKWCVRPEWVHLDTTPFASLLRNMGTLFGLGLGLHSPLYTETKKSSSALVKAGCVISSLLLLHLFDSFKPPTHTSATVPLVTVSIIPYCVNGALSLQNKKGV